MRDFNYSLCSLTMQQGVPVPCDLQECGVAEFSECRLDFEPSRRLMQAISCGYATKIWLMSLVGNERMSSGLRRWFKFDVAGMLSGEASQKSVFCS